MQHRKEKSAAVNVSRIPAPPKGCITALVLSVLCTGVVQAQSNPDGNASVKDDKIHLHVEKEITIKSKEAPAAKPACTAAVQIDYSQRNTNASVSGTLTNTMCPASHGDFVVKVSARNAAGETRTQEFTRTWQRTDNKDVGFKADYAIGDNTDLTRIRIAEIHCTCD